MSDERPKGFLSRVFGPVEDDDDRTAVYSSRESGYGDEADDIEVVGDEPIEETGRSFTVERAAEIIKHLPPEVPRSSAVRIVRQTLVAAGIDMEDLARSTEDREDRLDAEIEQREERIEDLRQRTDEEVRELERRIREAREERDSGIAAEERRITTAKSSLEDVQRVRDFFDLPRGGGAQDGLGEADESDRDYAAEGESGFSDETHVIDRSFETDDTTVIRRSDHSQSDWDTRSTGRYGQDENDR
ncbi:Hypothetical Protein RradSPS_0095 [Rubrobacter radiotolerans]|uniref:Uncharacterized protein n=1 Tax=Rubrobacter radiotolerans TaxID=42256 RepID=A0A023WZ59_RUBRA|nr:hypothetical protein [Rubrobacter radiotolerans]AHY45378.1 Hypothetical Protein RradSPS_0095 [Rubrobacter radiotolerans]MDX5892789.1 hypothetical protein [Rubrobacter radiotolerans]SMC02501.1 conserved hypothetical protein [Rubrobacter radiotolerans DSM 5868]